ncbi:MAG: membrane protein insertion efficiency factor YidD [Pseudomonadota bacterium]|nr:membrane protein insertion efficiency factor YidD [Pseudomonadota bacterium]
MASKVKNQQNNYSPLQRVALWLVRAYQRTISPIIGGRAACRFTPTCSQYAATAIAKYGALRGGLMALRRILRCNPFGGYGYDPVP